MNWIQLNSLSQLDTIVERSTEIPCLIFKHSTRCSISSMAKSRLDLGSEDINGAYEAYFLDLIAHRDISGAIAEKFGVEHESPQFLVIKNGECVADGSHYDVRISEVNDALLAKNF